MPGLPLWRDKEMGHGKEQIFVLLFLSRAGRRGGLQTESSAASCFHLWRVLSVGKRHKAQREPKETRGDEEGEEWNWTGGTGRVGHFFLRRAASFVSSSQNGHDVAWCSLCWVLSSKVMLGRCVRVICTHCSCGLFRKKQGIFLQARAPVQPGLGFA